MRDCAVWCCSRFRGFAHFTLLQPRYFLRYLCWSYILFWCRDFDSPCLGIIWLQLDEVMHSLTQLCFLSVFSSTMAFAFILTIQTDTTIWLTTLTYYFTLIYHLLVAIQNMPSPLWSRGSIIWAFTLCLSWILCSILSYVNNLGPDSSPELAFLLNGPEIIILASIGFVGIRKRRRRPQTNLAEA